MSDAIKGADVQVGDRVRIGELELTVSRIEPFLNMEGWRGFIEDTDERWLKVPSAADGDVTLLQRG